MGKKPIAKCTQKGCRKKALAGEEFCATHKTADLVVQSPGEVVTKMTEIERLNLVKIETECVNVLLQIRNQELEMEDVKRKFEADLNARTAHRKQLIAIAEVRKAEQQRTVREIAAKYGLEPQQMVYDPETGVLRDLRQEIQGS